MLDIGDEYSHPPWETEVAAPAVDLAPLGVQLAMPSRRRAPTTRLYTAPLDDAAIARIRARAWSR